MVETAVIVETILRLEKQPSLFDIHKDIVALVKELHPAIYSDVEMPMAYHATNGNIVDAYKSVAHVMLLNKIPGFKNDEIVRIDTLLEGIHKKFGIEYDFTKIDEIKEKMKIIIDKHCGISMSEGTRRL